MWHSDYRVPAPHGMNRRSRREFLGLGSAAVAAGLAGCSDVVLPGAVPDAPPASRTRTERRGASESSAFTGEVLDRAEGMAHEARRSVVKIRSGSAGGTGWILEDGSVVTNSHVVARGSSFDLETFGGETASTTRVGHHRDLVPDVALLETDLDGPDPLPTTDRSDLERGDPLVTIGHPGTVGDWVITIGRHERYEPGIDWLLSTVPVSQGNSGGPLLTLDGAVVGVVSGEATRSDGSSAYSKSDEVFEEMPSGESLTTSVPTGTLLESVEEWKG